MSPFDLYAARYAKHTTHRASSCRLVAGNGRLAPRSSGLGEILTLVSTFAGREVDSTLAKPLSAPDDHF
jgi:hypothetical protein